MMEMKDTLDALLTDVGACLITYLWFGVTDDDLMNSFKEIKRSIRSPKEIDSNKISKRIDKLEYDVTKKL